MTEQFRVQCGEEEISGTLFRSHDRSAGTTLILGHGAGAGQTSDFMVRFARGFAQRGLDVVTFDFPYMSRGRRLPDPGPRLEDCYLAVISHVTSQQALQNPRLVIGGKSLGGRIASQAAAREDHHLPSLSGLVFLGYPLHPPGNAQKLRTAHLVRVTVPMLFVQGTRDPFGTPQELEPLVATLTPGTRVFPVVGGDHSFKVSRAARDDQAAREAAIEDEVVAWIETLGHAC